MFHGVGFGSSNSHAAQQRLLRNGLINDALCSTHQKCACRASAEGGRQVRILVCVQRMRWGIGEDLPFVVTIQMRACSADTE